MEYDAIASNPTLQAYRFYRILVTRKDGFEALLKALEYTRQSSALTLLRKKSCDENDNTYLIPEDGPLLGKGSTGTSVHKGKFGNMDIAVKKMHVGIKSYEIEQELKALKDCGGHENVVRYLGTRKIEQFVLIGLELCEMTLEKWVKEKSIHIPQLEVLKQITNGLDWLHRRDFLHRDLKPANILLTQTPARVKLSDFGLSRYIADGRNSVSSFNTGTDGWIAPEVLRQQVSNVRQKLKFVSILKC
ncbi:unnamed protein product [Orchesella dallaii]|uniref:Protein kinase domain-containing protein n=1 Tax=Orchesella dallaii TaxID=48710 RepID=A0ABP1S0W3_9HEXA